MVRYKRISISSSLLLEKLVYTVVVENHNLQNIVEFSPLSGGHFPRILRSLINVAAFTGIKSITFNVICK